MKSNIIDQIIAMLHSQSGDDLKTEAYWVFMNGCTCGNDEQIEFFVNNGVIDLLMSLLRNGVPSRIRIIVQLVVIAALVILVDQVLKAFVYEVSKQLSVYVGLIITNCIVMGRVEAFALANKPWASFLDGIGNGLGYGLILVIVAFFRELFGSGSLLGFRIIPESWYMAEGGFYSNCGLMLFPPMALIIVGCIIWVHRSRNKDLQEK